ncbi:dihydrouridine synthase family protein [Neobacillus massiliamazoniensis]|uniref:Dihydrouridine synthase family protein n=1 Tax=Neobacillus massiliamazoniensis TaxID=1499688 RepID=A0A0U1NYW1_9BACI|nr:dihydrouridine synthase family protein [Neobacillus massiliamazoniensis]
MIDNFWRNLPRSFFVLAPMEYVTDVVFRHVVSEAGRADVFFTEFTNSDSYCHPEGMKSVSGRLIFTEMSSQWWHIFGGIIPNISVK